MAVFRQLHEYFSKTEVGSKVMTQNVSISVFRFFQLCKKTPHLSNVFCIFCIFVFFAVTFVPIKIWTHSVPQNDRLNLSFVKDFHIVGTKMARYGCKMAIYQMQILMINL